MTITDTTDTTDTAPDRQSGSCGCGAADVPGQEPSASGSCSCGSGDSAGCGPDCACGTAS